MSNICRGCGGLIEYSLVPLRNVRSNHCHFCVQEFKGRADKLGKQHEESQKYHANPHEKGTNRG